MSAHLGDIADSFGSGGSHLASSNSGSPPLRDVLRAILALVGGAAADVPGLQATKAADRADGQSWITLDTYTVWIWHAADATAPDATHIKPTDVTTGRFIPAAAPSTSVLAALASAASAVAINNQALTKVSGITSTPGLFIVSTPQGANGSGVGNAAAYIAQPCAADAAINVKGGSFLLCAGADNGITADATHFHSAIRLCAGGKADFSEVTLDIKKDGLGTAVIESCALNSSSMSLRASLANKSVDISVGATPNKGLQVADAAGAVQVGAFGTTPAARSTVSGALSGAPTLAQLTGVVQLLVAALGDKAGGVGWVHDTTT